MRIMPSNTHLRMPGRTVLLAALALLAASTAGAEAVQEYRVEILILRHLNNEARSFEAPEVIAENMFGDAASVAPESERRRIRYRNVPWADLQLGKANSQLRRSRDFRPLLHLGWTQEALDPERAGWVPVNGQAEDGTMIRGYARLAVSRYLHLRFELEAEIPDKGTFRIEESRRMKSGDLHYFDHPEFGALVTIIPEPPPPPPPPVTTGEDSGR